MPGIQDLLALQGGGGGGGPPMAPPPGGGGAPPQALMQILAQLMQGGGGAGMAQGPGNPQAPPPMMPPPQGMPPGMAPPNAGGPPGDGAEAAATDQIDKAGQTWDGTDAPTQNDIERLKEDPSASNIKSFDAQFGEGAAEKYVGEGEGDSGGGPDEKEPADKEDASGNY